MSERDLEKYTDAIRLAGCVMVGGGLGTAAELATAKGWRRVADVLHKATISRHDHGRQFHHDAARQFYAGRPKYRRRRSDRRERDATARSLRRPRHRVLERRRELGRRRRRQNHSLFDVDQSDFSPVKAVCQVVLSDETIAALGDEGLRILGTELKNSVAVGSDSAFLGALTGESGEAQGGDTWQGINDDIEELLRDLRLGAASRPFLIMTPAIAKSLAIEGLVNGVDISRLEWRHLRRRRDPRERRANRRPDHRG